MKMEAEYPYASLCWVFHKDVIRLADIDGDEIHEKNSLTYRNLEWLINDLFDVPKNFVGIWNWRPLQDSSESLRAVAKFDRDRIPIEIIILPDCSSDEKLTRILIKGADVNLSSGKALIGYTLTNGNYRGILCTDEDFYPNGKIKSSVSLQFFELNASDVIRVIGKIFYSKLHLGTPEQIVDSQLDQFKNEIDDLTKRRANLLQELARLQADYNKRCAELEQEIEFLQASRDEFGAQHHAPSTKKFYRPGKVIEPDVDNSDTDDFIYAFEDALGMSDNENAEYTGRIDKFALYLHAAFDSKIPLLLVGSRGRDIINALSIALTGRTAATFDCAAVSCLDDLNVISDNDDPIVSIVNPFAPNFIAYIPELLNFKNKFIVALYPFVEDLKLEPRSFFNYFTPVFNDLIFEQSNRIKTLTSSIDSTDHAALFVKFPLAYINGRAEQFIDTFKGNSKILDSLKMFLGDNQ